MGPDAMLVNSKRSNVDARHLGAYEVVVCGESSDAAAPGPVRDESPALTKTPPELPSRISQDISDLKRQMERLTLSLARSGAGMGSGAADPALAKAFASLTDAELDADLASELITGLRPPASAESLRAELRRWVTVDAELGCPGTSPKTVALVGPPGSGKTSALVKLAVKYGIGASRSVRILSVDSYRIAAADELRSYAEILGIGCQVFEGAAELMQALEENRRTDLVLIDTPGLGRTELDGFHDLARFLAGRAGMDTHLVLPASMRTGDLKRVGEQYSIFKPRKLLFTRLDETRTFGPILSQSFRMGIPVSFVCGGQSIPEDLDPATADRIADLILKSEPAGEQAGMAAA